MSVAPFLSNLSQSFDFSIRRDKIRNDTTGKIIPGMVTLTNTKTGGNIYTTNETYKHTSPEFFTQVAKEISAKTGLKLEGFHSFADGEKLLAYFRNEEIDQHCKNILKLDTENYLVIGTGNDGKDPFFVGSTEFILRCKNQWGRVNKKLKFKHTKFHEDAIMAFINSITLANVTDSQTIRTFEKMQKVRIDTDLLVSIVDRFLAVERPLNEVERKSFKLPTKTQNTHETILSNMEIEMKDLGKNLFGVWNGFTRFISHDWNGKNANSAPGNLLNGYERQTDKAFQVVNDYYEMVMA